MQETCIIDVAVWQAETRPTRVEPGGFRKLRGPVDAGAEPALVGRLRYDWKLSFTKAQFTRFQKASM